MKTDLKHINSLDYFSGIQLSFAADNNFDIELKDNSHNW